MTASLHAIRLFVAAYEEGSFTAAAQRENATQSGVSQHIRNLEELLGVTLFLRERSRPMPTPAGDACYRRCVETLRAHEAAAATARAYAGGQAGAIRVGLMPTMTRCAVAPVLAVFLDAHPNVAVWVVEGYSGTLTERVHAADLDFAIVPAAPTGPGIRARSFADTPEVLISRLSWDRPHLTPVRLGDLGRLDLILPGRENARRSALDAYLDANGADVGRTVELDAMLATLDLVSRTGWSTILPALIMADQIQARSFTVNPLSEPPLSLELAIIEPSRTSLSNAAMVFLEMLESHVRQLGDAWHAATAAHQAS